MLIILALLTEPQMCEGIKFMMAMQTADNHVPFCHSIFNSLLDFLRQASNIEILH